MDGVTNTFYLVWQILVPRDSMSLTACEAYLLGNKKDEIWQLLYVERRSVEETYEMLIGNGGEWIGERRFREAITEWERDDPQVWPSRLEDWTSKKRVEPHADSAAQSFQDQRLHDGASGSLSSVPEENQQISQGYISSSTGTCEDDPTNPASPSTRSRGPIFKVQKRPRPTTTKPSLTAPYPISIRNAPGRASPPSQSQSQSQSSSPRHHPRTARQESPTVNAPVPSKLAQALEAWNPSFALALALSEHTHSRNSSRSHSGNSNSNSNRGTATAAAACQDCGADHSSLQAYAYDDSSSSYTFVPYAHVDRCGPAGLVSAGRRRGGWNAEWAPAGKPVGVGAPVSVATATVFGYVVGVGGEGEDGGENEDEDADDVDDE